MKQILVYICCFSILITLAYAETLWDDRQAGLYSRNISLTQGDSVKIIVNEESKINYKSSTKSNKSSSVNIEGGQYSALFNFLPTGDGNEELASDNKDESTILTSLVATVSSVNGNVAVLQGQKTVNLNNKVSLVEISGSADTKFIKNGTINSSDLSNLSLRVTTLLANEKSIITDSDIVTQLKNPDNTEDTSTETVISEQKRKDLYLEYVNKVLSTIY